MTMTLNKNDIKILKKELFIGNMISTIIILSIIIFDLAKLLLNDIDLLFLIILNVLGIIFTSLFNILYNLNIRKDIKYNSKHYEIKRVDEKIRNIEYEVGSGALYIPLLSDLFPNIWGQKMNKEELLYFKIEDELIPVNNEIFDSIQINENVIIYYFDFIRF